MSPDGFFTGSCLRKCISHVHITGWAHCQRQVEFLSPPVLMHGGLLCVAFRLSVCLSVRLSVCLWLYQKSLDNNSLEKNSLEKKSWVKVKGHMIQGQVRVPNKGRWAHDNVKLLHLLISKGHWMLPSRQILRTVFTFMGSILWDTLR